MRTRLLKLALLPAIALATTALALLPPSVEARTALPRVPEYLSARTAELLVRPATITYTGDGTGVLGGRGMHARIHWTSWTSTRALGTGYDRVDTCARSCAGGPFIYYPVRIEAWKPGTVHGQHVFTRLTRWYAAKRPTSSPVHYTWTDLYEDGGWGFSPPGADGYCTHTEGQPRAAGCASITTLP